MKQEAEALQLVMIGDVSSDEATALSLLRRQLDSQTLIISQLQESFDRALERENRFRQLNISLAAESNKVSMELRVMTVARDDAIALAKRLKVENEHTFNEMSELCLAQLQEERYEADQVTHENRLLRSEVEELKSKLEKMMKEGTSAEESTAEEVAELKERLRLLDEEKDEMQLKIAELESKLRRAASKSSTTVHAQTLSLSTMTKANGSGGSGSSQWRKDKKKP